MNRISYLFMCSTSKQYIFLQWERKLLFTLFSPIDSIIFTEKKFNITNFNGQIIDKEKQKTVVGS